MKLLCLPYAGASASIYYNWSKILSSHGIQVVAMELAGRGSRFNTELNETIEDAVRDIYETYKSQLINGDYILFGHSFGGLLAYELTHFILSKKEVNQPKAIIYSGALPPHRLEYTLWHNLKDNELISKVREFGSIPEEVSRNEELKQYVLNVLRNDFRLIETYSHIHKELIPIDFYVFHGKTDRRLGNKYNVVQQWSELTSKKCVFNTFEGGHFFIHENRQLVLDEVIAISQHEVSLSHSD